MGCWNETCGVTHAPIVAGDQVVMLLFGEGAHSAWDDASFGELTHVVRGTYDDYGCVEGFDGDDHEASQTSIFVLREAWDHIQTKEREASGDDRSAGRYAMLVSRSQLEALSHIMPDGVPGVHALQFSEADYTEYLRVVRFCCNCRIDLAAGMRFKGRQCCDMERFGDLILMMKKAHRRLVRDGHGAYDGYQRGRKWTFWDVVKRIFGRS